MSQSRFPRLRFPEFQDAGEWEPRELGRIGEFVGGGTPDTSVPEYWDGEILWFTPTEIKERYLSKSERTITDKGLKNSSAALLPSGTLLISTRATIGDIGIAENPCATNQGFQSLVVHEGEVNLFWYYWFLQHKNELINRSSGSTFLEIKKTELNRIPALRPDRAEQKKIATCLSSLDELIDAQARKLDDLGDYKKGLMQQLFPQEGESNPRLRFPEFQHMKGWDKKLMQDLYSFHPTNSYSRELLNDMKGQVRNIHYGDIHTKYSTLFDMEKETVPFLSTSVPLDKIQPESFCMEGDIVFADASEDLNDVGKSIEIVKLNDKKLVSGLHTILARQKQGKLVIGFGGYLFKSAQIRAQIMKEAHGAKVAGISARRLSNIEIRYPWEQKEQQKILACLSSLDELIAAQTRRLDSLRIHKKGLMQQLFPKVEEVLS